MVLCDYLERGVLPLDEGMAKVILESEHHEVIQGVLHFEPVAFPGCLCVVVPRAYVLLFYKKLMLVVLLGILRQRCVTISVSIIGGRACGQMFSASVVGVWFVLVARVQVDLSDPP